MGDSDTESGTVKLDTVYQSAVQGTRWVFLQLFISRSVQLLTLVILARILVPEDFGVIALASIVFSILWLFYDMGTNTALIQRQGHVDALSNLTFWFNVVLGIFWYSVIWLSAPYCGDFFHEPRLPDVMRLMGLSFLIMPLSAVHHALLTKNFHFKKKSLIEVTAHIAGSGLTIALAISGLGIWSLVFGVLGTHLIHVLGTWITVSWRPRMVIGDVRLAGGILGFGGLVSVQGGLVWVVNTLDNILVGKWWKAPGLGLYEMGFNIGTLPAGTITNTLSGVIFPFLSKLQEDLGSVKRVYLKLIEYISLLSFPAGVGIAVTAPLFVPLLLGDHWVPAVPVIQFVSVYGLLASIGGVMVPLCNSQGRPDLLVKYFIFSVVTAVPAYWMAVPYGIAAMGFSHLVLVCLRFPLDIHIPSRLLGFSYSDFWRSLRAAVLGTAAMGAFALFSMHALLDHTDIPRVTVLFLTVFLSALLYVSMLFMMNREVIFEIRHLLRVSLYYRESGGGEVGAVWTGTNSMKKRSA